MEKNYKYICDIYNNIMFRVEVIKQTGAGYLSTEFDHFDVKGDDGKISSCYRQDLLTKKQAQKLLMKHLKNDLRSDEYAAKEIKDNIKNTKDKIKKLEEEMKAG